MVQAAHLVLSRFVRPLIDQGKEDEEEVEALIEVGERDGILEADEGQMMRSIVDMDETAVREIMPPRPDIEALLKERVEEEVKKRLLDKLLGDEAQPEGAEEGGEEGEEQKDPEDVLKDKLKDLFKR